MIRIAILDDRRAEIEQIRSITGSFAQTVALPVEIKTFSDAFDFIEYVEKEGGFDIYLLDIILPHMTGIQIAERLRRRGERCEIVFLTTSREYGVDAFGVNAAGYLVKPVSMQNFSEVLSRVFANLLHSNRPPVFIRINGGRRKVLAEEIVLIESFNHRREILLSDGQKLETAMTLKELEELLKEYGEFCSPHRTYIVNLDHVRGVQGNNLLLKDRVLPIAKNSYRKLKEYYLKYSFDK